MENQPNSIGSLLEHAGGYVKTSLDLLKLQAISKTSDAAATVVSRVAILLVATFAFILVNIGLSLWVGELLGKPYLGFLVVAGFYALVALLLHVFRDTWIKEPISTNLIKKMLN